MHFAFPPRKTSNPPPYAARSKVPPLTQYLRGNRLRSIGILVLGVVAFLYVLSGLLSGSDSAEEVTTTGTPPVVIVTTIDSKAPKTHNDQIKQNRIDYAKRHGYETFFPYTDDYPISANPSSWSKIPALRHASALYPHASYLWYLSSQSLITAPSLSLEKHLLDPSRLEALLIPEQPVVPPDSVIKTFAHLHAPQIHLILTQDAEGLDPASIVLRNGEWARYFLDTWFDPLYRSYNFQRAERHALEHLIQWHATILSRLALVEQRVMNALTRDAGGKNGKGLFQEGDFVANFEGCNKGSRSCEEEMRPFFERLAKGEAV